MATLVIDHIENITIDSLMPRVSNPHALDYLPQGVFTLAQRVRMEEAALVKQSQNTFMMTPPISPVTICGFHWFNVTLVNYIRLVGLLRYMNNNNLAVADLVGDGNVKPECASYVKSVVPELKTWRDKVMAHFATTDPGGDKEPVLEQAVMANVSLADDRLCVGFMSVGIGDQVCNLPRWSLTEVYERLAPRYWPRSVLSSDPSKAVAPDRVQFGPPKPF